ncbi:MAG: hypothetical protein ACYDAC_10185 [Candidatus Dormibacteria bacterium]
MASEAAILRDIFSKQARGVPLTEQELRGRVDALGDMHLDTPDRQRVLADLGSALMPPNFEWILTNQSCLTVSDHRVTLVGDVNAKAEGLLAAQMERSIWLDHHFVDHSLLVIGGRFRGKGLSLILLNQAFGVYRKIGLKYIAVHAALETGRWHWARLGFTALDEQEYALIVGWAGLCSIALGHGPLPPDPSLHYIARLGSTRGQMASLEQVHNAVAAALSGGPLRDPAVRALLDVYDRRARLESYGAWGWDSVGRLRDIADRNDLAYDNPMPLGKAIMNRPGKVGDSIP